MQAVSAAQEVGTKLSNVIWSGVIQAHDEQGVVNDL
jgi:hypothetical protein